VRVVLFIYSHCDDITEKWSIVIIGLADNLRKVVSDNTLVSGILQSWVSSHILSNFL
jgi:hypothetical protein